MILIWTKQFMLATALFTTVLGANVMNAFIKEKQIANKILNDTHRTVNVKTKNYNHIN